MVCWSRAAEAKARLLLRSALQANKKMPDRSEQAFLQQGIRAGLHMIQFGIAYIVMLLAMYYNGYFIISIFLGAFVGSFVFNWETLGGSA
jgi:hypothetical protein